MSNSTHRVEVVRVTEVLPHPNADRLQLIPVFSGYLAAVSKGDFEPGELAAFVPPDSIVDLHQKEFSFLGQGELWASGVPSAKVRIKARKLRGVWSQGLLIHAPEGSTEGQNVAEQLGVIHYDPPVGHLHRPGHTEEQELGAPANGHGPRSKYDIEAWRRYGNVMFTPGEEIVLHEKLHGANAAYVFDGSKTWAKSRYQWKKELADSLWWKALNGCLFVRRWLEEHPGWVLCGEVYGQVQDLTYGTCRGEVRFAAFDLITPEGNFCDYDFARRFTEGVPWVPEVYRGPYDATIVETHSRGSSLIPNAKHVREGVVIRPIQERERPRHGRVVLKIINDAYLERA